MTLGDGNTTFAQAAYTYDVQSRVATVGNAVDTLTYAYRPGLNQVAGTAWTNATALPTAYAYDQYHRLTDIAVNNSSVYGYTLNAKNQRIAGLLGNGDHWAYGYDGLGQLATAVKQDGNDNPLHSMSYLYDQIGNRTSAIEDAATTGYTANLVNQYTLVNAAVPTYDADGNMLTHGDWTYTYNAENRLVKAESDDVKVECDYDYMGRRIWKKVYDKGLLGLDWSLDEHRKFVYDGYKLIAEFDALNSDALLANYLWQPVGLDVPLMRTANSVNEYVIADGNKNIIELRDATGVITDTYDYTPFGGVTHSGGSDNPFQFSSEYLDSETGLIYYNYRYYSLTLARWINRDPIEEQGGVNLYGMVKNNSINQWDSLGMWGTQVHYNMTAAWAISLKIPEDAAEEIGQYDDAVDGGALGVGLGWAPWGSQGLHFNRNASGRDSRDEYSDEYLKKAKMACSDKVERSDVWGIFSWTESVDYPHAAAQHLGTALHPAQDKIAHINYGRYNIGTENFIIHNYFAPKDSKLPGVPGDLESYPDNPDLDAGKEEVRVVAGIKIVWYQFRKGRDRINKTEAVSLGIMNNFLSHLKSQKKCCKCKEFFGVK